MKHLLALLLSFFFLQAYSQDKHIEKGNLKMEEHDYSSAIKFYSKSINKSASTAGYNYRAKAYLYLGEKTKAINDYTYSLELDDTQTNIWVARGKLYLIEGKYSKAESDLTTALKLDDKNEEALVERGETYSKKNNVPSACEDWAKAASLGDKRGKALLKIKCSETVELSTDYMQEKIRK